MARMENTPKEPPGSAKPGKRPYVRQTDVPSCSLEQALGIAQAIRDEYGKRPTAPLDVAAALELQPQARSFRMMAGASMAYGFTEGGPQADVIALTELGTRAVAPTEEGDDLAARREAFQRPRVIREFLERYDGSPLPSEQIGRNVLEGMGVDTKVAANVLTFIIEGAESLGLLREIGGKKYVHLRGAHLQVVPPPPGGGDESDSEAEADELPPAASGEARGGGTGDPSMIVPDVPPVPERNRRVFVSHGSNKKIVEQLKGLLSTASSSPSSRWSARRPRSRYPTRCWMTCGPALPGSSTSGSRR